MRQPSLVWVGCANEAVYKWRRLQPVEEVGLPNVLDRLLGHAIPGLCGLKEYFLSNRELTLSLEYVEGESLRHQHTAALGNQPSFVQRLKNLGFQKRIAAVATVLSVLDELHAAGLAYGDLKTEQLMIRKDGSACLVDLDCIVNLGSASAQFPVVQSFLDPFCGSAVTVQTDMARAALLMFEIMSGDHLFRLHATNQTGVHVAVMYVVENLLPSGEFECVADALPYVASLARRGAPEEL